MPRVPRPRPRLRRFATASLVLSLLLPLGAACGNGDEQGQPLERTTSENPGGAGQPATTTSGTAGNEYTPGANNDTGQAPSGQPQSGTGDSGGGNNSNTVNGN